MEWHVWSSSSGNNYHAVQRSLSSSVSVYECTMGFFYLVPFRQPSTPMRFPLITAIRMCHFLPVHHFGMASLAGSKVKIQHNIIITPSDKGGSIIIMDSTHYNNKMIRLLHDKNTYEQISLQTVTKNIDIFNKSDKKSITKEDKFWSSLIDYHTTIPKNYTFTKTHKPGIPLCPIIWDWNWCPAHL